MLCINKYEFTANSYKPQRTSWPDTHGWSDGRLGIDIFANQKSRRNIPVSNRTGYQFVMQFQWYAINSKRIITVINFLRNSCLIVFISENQRTNELTYSNMQIIAREVELQTMRRSAPKDSTDNATKTNKTLQKPKPQNHLQRLNTKGAVAKTKDLVRFVIIRKISWFGWYWRKTNKT